MKYLKGRILIALCIALLMLPLPTSLIGEGTPQQVTTFSDGSTVRTVSFGPGGGWNNSTSITLPRGVSVTGANMTVSPGSRLETGHFFANASAMAAGASSNNLSLRGNNVTLSDGDWWWGQDIASGYAGTVLTDVTIKKEGVKLTAGNETWTQKTSAVIYRFWPTAVWDSQNNQMLVFGGMDHVGGCLNETWAYNPSKDTWTQKASGPIPRYFHTAVWDCQNNQMLVFGGYNNSFMNYYLNDTWVYCPSTDIWTQKASGATPRYGHTAVWDRQNSQMLVFGGYNSADDDLNDTWSYSPSTNTWTQKASGATPRYCHTAVWDSQNNQMLVFGGSNDFSLLNDLWAYGPSTNTWTQKASGATPRKYPSAVWDSQNNQMLVIGGFDDTNGYKNDSWAYCPSANTWTQKASWATQGYPHIAVWDSQDNQILVFGGDLSSSYLWSCSLPFLSSGTLLSPILQNQLASYGSVHANITLPASTSYSIDILDAVTNATLQSGLHNGDPVTVQPTEHPSIHLKLTMSTSDNRATPVLHGWGLGTRIVEDFRQPSPGQNAVNVTINDGLRLVYDWGWIYKARITTPTRRSGHTAVWDNQNNQMLVFGGSFSALNDLWAYTPPNNWWTQKASGAPGRYDHTAVWDNQNNQMLVFGGQDENHSNLNDTWAYSPSSDTWTQKASGPSAIAGHTAVWDSQNNQMLVFGGYNETSSYLNDLWAYNPTTDTWTQKTSGATPRIWHTAVWDSQSNQMLIFGGGDDISLLDDLWVYSPSNDTWGQKTSGATPRIWHTAVWDSQSNQMLVHGGGNDTSDMCDLWAYNTFMDTWTQKTRGPERVGHTAVWDNRNYQMLIFGGANNTYVWYYNRHYLIPGALTSPVCNLPAIPASFRPITCAATTPPGTSVSFNLSSSPDYVTWSPWEKVTNSSSPKATPPARYLQWRANLSTTDETVTPVLHSLTIGYSLYYNTGSLTSGAIQAPAKLVKATLRLNATLKGGTIVIQLSADGGAHWENATGGLPLTFQYPGKSLMYRLVFNAAPDGASPVLQNISVDYSYDSFPTGVKLTVGNFTHLLGNLTGNISVDMASDLNDIINSTGPGPGDITILLALFSTSVGVLNLTDLSITFIANRLPEISGPQPAAGATVNSTDVALNWTASDLDNDTLLFEVVLNGTVAASNLTAPGFLLQNLTRNTAYSWRIRAFDGKTWSAGPDWCFTVAPVPLNNPPSIELLSPADNTLIHGTELDLFWQGSDPDNDSITYLLFFDTTNARVLYHSTGTTAHHLTNLRTGTTYYWRVVASDGRAETSSETRRIKVAPDRPPVFTTTSLPNATVGKPYSFHLCATDPDGDQCMFALVAGPPNLIVDSKGMLLWTPGSSGKFQITIRVDAGALNVSRTFVINVRPAAPSSQTRALPDWMSLAIAAILAILMVGIMLIVWRKKPSGGGAIAKPEKRPPKNKPPTKALKARTGPKTSGKDRKRNI